MQQTVLPSCFRVHGAFWLRLGAVILLLAAGSRRLAAQCERVGWVAHVTPGCGARIIDLNNGELLKAAVGAENLIGGKTIRFSSAPVTLPPGCSSDGLKVVALTCVSDTLPCVASFGYAVHPENAYRLSFEADVYDPTVQFCFWNFGDGATATGYSVQHTFAQEGYYMVCLTITDAYGCSTKKCKSIFVSDENPNWCGYDVEVTAVGTKLFGSIGPVVSDPGALISVKWFDNKTNAILAETPQFTATLPGEGTYFICAQYEVLQPDDNTVCTTTRCHSLTVATASCVNTAMVNNAAICPSFFAPVCACNGVTYTNECEAIAAGVTKWWTGECGAPGAGSCSTDIEPEIISGNPTDGYWVRFQNLAGGNYSVVQLDFGDGSPLWQGTPADTAVEHHYAKGGIYRTNLTVWKSNNCVSSVTKLLVTDAFNMTTDNLPAGTDYVMPGDANGDRKANVYDLLNIGLGFAGSGSPRPFATTAWTPQFAPNWAQTTLGGVNFKHIDCDGNGVVNDFDRNAIEQNYAPIDTGVAICGVNAPKIWVKFSADTLLINPNTPAALQIDADIMVGSATKPVFNLYGLAFALRYPEFVNHDPDIYYSTSSFFGFPTDILLLPKDNYARRQFDMGFARKYGQPVSGYGSIAKMSFSTDFIIIIDVIERSGSTYVPVVIPVVGLRAINAAGSAIEIEGVVRDTLWLKMQESVTATDNALERQTLVFPNPASGDAGISVGNLTLEHVDVFDALGRRVESHTPAGLHTTRLNVRQWRKGVYLLHIRTAEGLVVKKLAVQ